MDSSAALGRLPTPELAPFSLDVIRFSVAAWPLRAADELRSALIYRALAKAGRTLANAGHALVPEALYGKLRAAIADEARHARLCVEVGRLIGAPPPQYDVSRVEARLATLPDAVGRVAALLIGEVAIGETISVSLFEAGSRQATEPLTKFALTAIHADEVRHAALGWEGVAMLLPLLDEAARRALWVEASRALGASEQQNAAPAMRHLAEGKHIDPACEALGVLAPETRVAAFYAGVEEHVIPALDRLGLDGTRAWQERYRS